VLTKSGGGTVTLDYYIKDGRIFNVIVIGVSDLSLRRADYVAVIKHQGYLFLLASLKAKLAALGN
jgi:ABC-type transporter MlaC component